MSFCSSKKQGLFYCAPGAHLCSPNRPFSLFSAHIQLIISKFCRFQPNFTIFLVQYEQIVKITPGKKRNFLAIMDSSKLVNYKVCCFFSKSKTIPTITYLRFVGKLDVKWKQCMDETKNRTRSSIGRSIQLIFNIAKYHFTIPLSVIVLCPFRNK